MGRYRKQTIPALAIPALAITASGPDHGNRTGSRGWGRGRGYRAPRVYKAPDVILPPCGHRNPVLARRPGDFPEFIPRESSKVRANISDPAALGG